MLRALVLAIAVLASLPAYAQRTRLTVYTALENDQLALYKQAAEAALKNVEIAFVRDSTGVITARLLAEKANPRADVIWGLSVFSVLQMQGQDMLAGYTPKEADMLRPNFRSDRSPMTWTGMDAFTSSICYNTVIAKQKNWPTPALWTDLLNPVFKNQIVMPNPNSSGTGFLTVAGWMGEMGTDKAWSFMSGLNDNIAVYLHSGSAPCTNAARGEYGIGIGLDMRAVELRNQGAPIDIIVPHDGVGYDLEATAILKGTKKMDAAQRLVDFTVSAAAHKLYGKFYALLGRTDVQPSIEGYPDTIAKLLVKADFTAIADQRAEILKQWAAKFDSKSAPKK